MGNFHKSLIVALSVILVFESQLKCVQSENILVYGAVGSQSIRISMLPFMEALAEKGHNVTFFSPYDDPSSDQNSNSKVNLYVPQKWKAALRPWEEHIRFFDIRKAKASPFMWYNLNEFGLQACQVLYSDPEFIDWVKTSKFDMIIMEYTVNECVYGLVHLFQAKLVVYGASTVFPWCSDAYGLPDESSSIADVMFDFKSGHNSMTFFERVKNAISPILFEIKRENTYFPALEELTRNALKLGQGELPSFREIEQNTSLVLLTTHFTIDVPRALPPHVIPIGGAIAAGSNVKKPLPKEIKDFVDSAKSGFIFISFGTVAEFTNFDEDVQKEFINALFSFPEIKFLWKASVTINETLPGNVMLTKWAPQQSVLEHPKIKAFITHCGMGSVAEAVHYSVPLLMLPVLGEQDLNANAIESKGAGIKLEILTLKKHELEQGISEILNKKQYRESMNKLSAAFRDRPTQPVENAVWWIEYILRHDNSNEYLVPLNIRQAWWKRRQIDIWLTVGFCLLISIAVLLTVAYFVLKTIIHLSSLANVSYNIKYKSIKIKVN